MTLARLADSLRLVVITDEALARPRSVPDVVASAVTAGAPAVQLRAKGASARELHAAGLELLPIVRDGGALFFVNDRVDVALALGADGVHLGPDDLPVAAARRAAQTAGRTGSGRDPDGPRPFFIGASADDPATARRLVADGADYIGCGTVFTTSTKADAGEAIGIDGLQRVVDAVHVPVVAIGGIHAIGSAQVAAGSQAAGVAVVGAVMGAEDVEATVASILQPWLR
ncbi:MAG: thiamine phosphate synthase [Gemmatimonadetes bacterium]|nr:thiamine phosphate synthase [Gemmatimonadota bacterium]